MKTTIDIADDLVLRAKQLQQKQSRTLRSLVEEGLRMALDKHEQERAQARPVKLTVFGDDGLSEEAKAMGWQKIIELANER